MKIKELAARLKELNEKKKALKDELADVNKEIDRISKHELPELMEETGVEKVSLEGIGTVYITTGMQVRIKDMPRVIDRLHDLGHGDLVYETVHPQSLKALIKELMEDGEEPFSDDEVDVYLFEQARIRKS